EVEVIDPLKLLAFDSTFKAEKVPIVPRIRSQAVLHSGSDRRDLAQHERCLARRESVASSIRELDEDLRSKNFVQQVFIRCLDGTPVILDGLQHLAPPRSRSGWRVSPSGATLTPRGSPVNWTKVLVGNSRVRRGERARKQIHGRPEYSRRETDSPLDELLAAVDVVGRAGDGRV